MKVYDEAYFEAWYRRRGMGSPAALARKVALAVSLAEYFLGRPLRSVLDVGCGEGAWRAPLLELRPKLRYLGVDSSEYAISRYGARRNLQYLPFADLAALQPASPFDLLVCSDVMHYLPLLYVLALQRADDAVEFFNAEVRGSMSMRSVLIGA